MKSANYAHIDPSPHRLGMESLDFAVNGVHPASLKEMPN